MSASTAKETLQMSRAGDATVSLALATVPVSSGSQAIALPDSEKILAALDSAAQSCLMVSTAMRSGGATAAKPGELPSECELAHAAASDAYMNGSGATQVSSTLHVLPWKS